MSVRPSRSIAHRKPAAVHGFLRTTLARFLLLLACAVAATSCNNGVASLYQGPSIPIEMPPASIACPDADDASAMALLPPALPVSKPAAAGSIHGAFSVSSTGEAIYTLALSLPPARAGMAPPLSLIYESSAGEGPLGFGFVVGGLSSVTRCPRTISRDGMVEPVRDLPTDALCFDGRRLLPVDPGSAKPLEYRLFPDSFTKIVADYADGEGWDAALGPKSFRAYTRDGMILELGAKETGRVLSKGGVVRSWLLTGLVDRSSNAVRYTYVNTKHPIEGYTREHALSRIDYTDHPKAPASRAVVFEYGVRAASDARSLFARGMELRRELRLDHIRMEGPEKTLIRTYNLSYTTGPATKRLLLKQIEECAASGPCKPPTRFAWSHGKTGFVDLPTSIPAPESKLGSVFLADISGDGLDDLVVPDAAISDGFELPATNWLVALNKSARVTSSFFDTSLIALQQDHGETSIPVQPEFGTPLDYDANGLTDIFLQDLNDDHSKWYVLLAKPDHSFALKSTGIQRPNPLGPPAPFHVNSEAASVHLADVSGDGMTDLIQCEASESEGHAWRVHIWKPAGLGFDVVGTAITALEGRPCNAAVETVDIDADGRVDLLVQKGVGQGLGSHFEALSFVGSTSSWTIAEPNLALPPLGGRLLFLDVNGDALPDSVMTGLGEPFTFINTGGGFSEAHKSLPTPQPGAEDFARFATIIDFNADGRQDILIPMPAAGSKPAWMIWQATGSVGDGTFALVDAGLPFEALLVQNERLTLADPHGPRVTDVDGDQIQDVILLLGSAFHVFKNQLHEEDLLVSVTDGLNAHDPGDPGFLPNVQIKYDHLIDLHQTTSPYLGLPEESWTYLSDSEASGTACKYPLRCVVGPMRVVSGYTLATGETTPRRYAVAYRNGRYDRLGEGFLGFGERITRDLDTGAGTLEGYQNTVRDEVLHTFPFAGQPAHVWRWNPPLPREELNGDTSIELSYTDVTYEHVTTLGGRSYFTMPVSTRQRREQGTILTCDPLLIEDYVRETHEVPALVMSYSMQMVWANDEYGNVTDEVAYTQGVDDWVEVERTFQNDEAKWLLGLVKSETECGTTGALTQCRVVSRSYDTKGRLLTEAISADNDDPETKRTVKLTRDAFGNVVSVSEKDGSGNQRLSCESYDAEGVFPVAYRNPAGHLTLMQYNAGLGVQTALVGPNKLVTRWAPDGFGNVAYEERPDGTSTAVTIERAKNGGSSGDAWAVRVRSKATGGEDSTVELDPLGRPVRAWQQNVKTGAAAPPRVVQEVHCDELGEHVARSLVPISEQAAPNSTAFDHWEHDSIGRPRKHSAPWGAITTYRYLGRITEVTGPGGAVTVIESDAKGRPVKIEDPEDGVLRYTYGPFGELRTVTDPGLAQTTIERDGLGRVRVYDDPDRGETESHYNGFGDRISSTDEAGRTFVFTQDALGRETSRTDPDGTTTWTYDTAPNGIGQLAEVTSPGGIKVAYSFDTKGRPKATERTVNGDTFTVSMTYDSMGRLDTLAYPEGSGLPPFAVKHSYDDYGHLLEVKDAITNAPYWQLLETDNAGRVNLERFGDGAGAATTSRSYLHDKNRVTGMLTKVGSTKVQSLSYSYDDRLNLKSRTDERQGITETFGYDRLDRLTSAGFGGQRRKPTTYTYQANGNLIYKSDVGNYIYDPSHPHAVLFAGGKGYANDAVGNQWSRPGSSVEYTAFDMPKAFHLDGGAGTIGLEYDGNQERVRKTTASQEIIYAGTLYERVTPLPSGEVESHYYVYNSERLVATVTRKVGDVDQARFVHVDNLGSVDAVTDAAGAVVARQSFDAFGAPRNPEWGGAWVSGKGKPTLRRGFTGHEMDAELGLVNAKGRLYDPTLGRFLTADPFISRPTFSQSWNPFSYTLNNPLAYVDPSGFSATETGEDDSAKKSSGLVDGLIQLQARVSRPIRTLPSAAKDTGAAQTPVDVAVTGNAAGGKTEAPPTETDKPSGSNSLGNILLGGLWGLAKMAVVSGGSAMVQVITGIDVNTWLGVKGAIDGIRKDGFWGYIDAVSPATPILEGSEKAYDHAVKGELPEAAEAIVPVVVGVAAGFIAGAKVGGSSAPKGAGAAAAAAEAGSVGSSVVAGEAGAFGALDARAVVGDGLSPHHMPQAALGFTSRAEGGALVVTHAEHALTRTYRGRGRQTARADAGLSFRNILAQDIRDMRRIVGPKYDPGLRDLLRYYRTNFPELMAK